MNQRPPEDSEEEVEFVHNPSSPHSDSTYEPEDQKKKKRKLSSWELAKRAAAAEARKERRKFAATHPSQSLIPHVNLPRPRVDDGRGRDAGIGGRGLPLTPRFHPQQEGIQHRQYSSGTLHRTNNTASSRGPPLHSSTHSSQRNEGQRPKPSHQTPTPKRRNNM